MMEPNNGRHVPRPSHHGNTGPFRVRVGGRAGLRGQVFILICVHRLLAVATADTWRMPRVGITSRLLGLTV